MLNIQSTKIIGSNFLKFYWIFVHMLEQ